jgi:pyrimidine-nucleoside phosphorylase
MLSGRGLGHTGGTLDKLEAIPGYRWDLSLSDFIRQVDRVGLAVIGQTGEIAPADGRLYALRDATATVDSIPLIIASIVSKKVAAGPGALVYDVKAGRGAFMRDRGRAGELARGLVSVTRRRGRRATALVTRMDEPLGREVGNAPEVAESIAYLRGDSVAPDLDEVCREVAASMLEISGLADGREAALARVEDELGSGRALEKLREWVAAQGGDPAVADDPGLLPRASVEETVPAPRPGTVAAIDAYRVGLAGVALGVGRARMEDEVDLSAGIRLPAKVGDPVSEGEAVAVVSGCDSDRVRVAAAEVAAAVVIADRAERPSSAVLERIGS